MSPAPLSHDTVEERERIGRWLVAFGAGLLDEERETLLEQHLTACAECREQLAVLRNSPEAGDELASAHIPASLIATWPREVARLRGLERRAVEHHLRGCETCREELLLLGHSPELPAVTPPAQTEVARGEPRMAAASSKDHGSFTRWLVPGWAVLATAASVFLFLGRLPQTHTNGPAPDSTGRGDQPARFTGLQLPFDLTRGGDTTTPPEYTVPPGHQLLVLSPLPILAKPADAPTTLDVLDERDSLLVSTRCTLGELDGRVVPIDTGDRGFPSGLYVLRVTIAAGQGLEAREMRFPFKVTRRL